MHDLAEVIEKSKDVKELKEKLLDCLKAEISAKGIECVDTKEAGEVVDMIKDLAEAEKACMEAVYYQKVTEAMVSYEEPRYGESFGYNPNRYSSGRYAPKGRGTRMGFMPHVPYMDYDGEMDPKDYMREAMMGYSGGSGNSANTGRGGNYGTSGSSSNMGGSSGSNMSMGYNDPDMDPRYGRAYNEYRMKRRHYTTSKSPDDKRDMSTHAEEHVQDTVTTMRDIWKDADPDLKKRMHEDLSKLLAEMKMETK